jgi:hypothetical protein
MSVDESSNFEWRSDAGQRYAGTGNALYARQFLVAREPVRTQGTLNIEGGQIGYPSQSDKERGHVVAISRSHVC